LKRLVSLYVSIVLVLLFLTPVAVTGNELLVHFIDVGQGDSILIQTPECRNMLIDGGDTDCGEKLKEYLRSHGVEVIDVLVSTHPHADHIGGLIPVIRDFEVKAVYDSAKVHTTRTYESYLELIDEKDIPFFVPRRGDTILLGTLAFEVLHPVDVEECSVNNASIVLRVEYGRMSFLFTGDGEKEAEDEMLQACTNLDAVILKVGHHGSRTSSQEAFISAVKPKVAIIMVGDGNRYGHPDQLTLDRLVNYGAEVYSTCVYGTVIIQTNGETYKVLPSAECRFVESAKSNKFHEHTSRWAQIIQSENQIWFSDVADAVKLGDEERRTCRPKER
jgi:competence protein ComEC